MDTIEFDQLVANVSDALETKEDKHNRTMVLVGEVAVVFAVAYVGAKLIQSARRKRWMDKHYGKKNRKGGL